jgi:dihydropteroate synthase
MGILNITPDSFYAGSRHASLPEIIKKATSMVQDGAHILDIGGYSTRPGADDIPQELESQRILPVIQAIRKVIPEVYISVDTFRSAVARQAVEAGADIVNDVSGGELDPLMFQTVADLHVPYICMHMRGTPQTMTSLSGYENLLYEIINYFHKKVDRLHQSGVKDIIIDPGFGFAKTIEQSFELLRHLDHMRIIGKPILVGLSRKSMIWKTLNISADEALNGTTALNMAALQQGASIVRVHDVREAVQTVKLFGKLAFPAAGV